MKAYITSAGAYLPGDPIGNDEIQAYLGSTSGSKRLARRMLEANGIEKRHYALDRDGRTTMLNEELAERAIRDALDNRGFQPADVGMLAVGTTQADLPVPGFASMVHARLGGGPMEILSAGGVCCSGVAALRAVEASVRLGRHGVAVSVGSELVSRTLRALRFPGQSDFDAEFLRWMLSDGAGAVVVEPEPRSEGVSLRIDWSHLVSHADRLPLCMYAGVASPGSVEPGSTWQDMPDPGEAYRAGMLNLRQDTGILNNIVALGVTEYVGLVRQGLIEPNQVDHLLVHYSSEYFRSDIVRLMSEAGLMIPEDRWFTNLRTKGNTGAASIYIMLDEALNNGRFSPGERILLMVPESGRFSVSFVHLTCVAPPQDDAIDAISLSRKAGPENPGGKASEWLLEELALVWSEFEVQLSQVPIVRRIEGREATIADYRRLLRNLRQQVKEGARWITRAASSLTSEYADLRAEFIDHAAEEQLDFRMLDDDYVAVGGRTEGIVDGDKNAGSEALSAFMFNQANQENPLDLLGAMYIIEGLGANKATRWMELLRDQLDLEQEQIRFLSYHGGADEEHTAKMFEILRSELITDEVARSIVHTARVVARLYALQLEEVDRG